MSVDKNKLLPLGAAKRFCGHQSRQVLRNKNACGLLQREMNQHFCSDSYGSKFLRSLSVEKHAREFSRDDGDPSPINTYGAMTYLEDSRDHTWAATKHHKDAQMLNVA